MFSVMEFYQNLQQNSREVGFKKPHKKKIYEM